MGLACEEDMESKHSFAEKNVSETIHAPSQDRTVSNWETSNLQGKEIRYLWLWCGLLYWNVSIAASFLCLYVKPGTPLVGGVYGPSLRPGGLRSQLVMQPEAAFSRWSWDEPGRGQGVVVEESLGAEI